jgi:hypothetical protein
MRMTYDNPILNEREKTHGDYIVQAEISQALKDVLARMSGYPDMPAPVRESLEMICCKMARLVCGDYRHDDSWCDIAGYADLARSAIRK